MGDWTLYGQAHKATVYPGGGSYHVSLAPHASSANTKGSWTQIVAALPYDSILIPQVTVTANFYEWLFDIGIGGAGSEVVLVSNLHFDCAVAYAQSMGYMYPIPIIVPSGTRIAFRSQCSFANKPYYTCVTAIHVGGFAKEMLCNSSTTYGDATADSGGTSIDPGAIASTDGSWVQLTAATTAPCKAFFLCIGNQGNTGRSDYAWKMDVAVGAAAAEQEIVSDFVLYSSSYNSIIVPNRTPIFPITIPIGTRISVRAMCNGTGTDDRKFDVILYTFS